MLLAKWSAVAPELVFSVGSASLVRRNWIISKPELLGREEAITRGVQPEASGTSGSKVRVEERSLIMGRCEKAVAQWRGRRESESVRVESLGFAERRDSTAWTGGNSQRGRLGGCSRCGGRTGGAYCGLHGRLRVWRICLIGRPVGRPCCLEQTERARAIKGEQ